MEHRQLMNFLALCGEKNFTRAAEKRFITQQGLSRSIRELEKELDAPLFDRNRRGAVLTEYGEVLMRAARAWESQHEYVLETIRAMKEGSGARLSIGIAIDCPLPPDFLADFIVTHPEIRLSVQTFPLDVCQEQLLEQRLQAGFLYPPINPDLFDAFLFEKAKINLVAGKTHHLAERKSVRTAELRNENIIAYTTALHPNPSMLELLRRNGVVPETRLASLDFSLVAELCATGRYAGFGGTKVPALKDLVEIEIADAELYAELFLVVNRRAVVNRAAEVFIESAKTWAERGGRAAAHSRA